MINRTFELATVNTDPGAPAMTCNQPRHRRFQRVVRAAFVSLLCGITTISEAAVLGLSDTPLFLTAAAEPNIILTFDDSGSMGWGFMPDNVGGVTNATRPRSCSHVWNKLYYNPGVTYLPAVNANGTPLNAALTADGSGNASFTGAWTDGYHAGTGLKIWGLDVDGQTADFTTVPATVDLSADTYRASWNLYSDTGSYGPQYADCGATGITGAFYFQYNPNPSGSPACPNLPLTAAPAAGCFTQKNLNDAEFTDADRQNFANWFSYYRTRDLAAKAAAGRAMALLPNSVRVAGNTLNQVELTDPFSRNRFTRDPGEMQVKRFCNYSASGDPLCRSANGQARTDFFTRLYNSYPRDGGTPLHDALKRVGEHYSSTALGTRSPYLPRPMEAVGDGNTEEAGSCRPNFHVLMTDGYWNDLIDQVDTDSANDDGSDHTLPDSVSYVAASRHPYYDAWGSDSDESTLADWSFHFWHRDLRTDLTNNVPARCRKVNTAPGPGQSNCDVPSNYWDPDNDPANWQHMVTYSVGFGVPGTLDSTNSTTWNNLKSGTQAWPNPFSSNPARIDDLWHAAVNSRGHYFNTSDPGELTNAFLSIINSISELSSASSAVATNSGSLTTNSFVYQSRFESKNWTGQLLAFGFSETTGALNATPAWDAGYRMSSGTGLSYSNRQIISFNPTTRAGIPFEWTNLSTAQQADLNKHPVTLANDGRGQERLNYLRGLSTNEGTATDDFRKRYRRCSTAAPPGDLCPTGTNTGVLGDIVNSAPAYVGAPPFDYTDTGYASFRSAQTSRRKMLYVGANDGMLHGFDADSGDEIFAYVPGSVYPKLSQLTSKTYAHKYFVDGSPIVADVYMPSVGGGSWRTILVSALRKGGQGVFALDITDPDTFTQTAADANVVSLWEFTDANSSDLGYVYGDPSVVKLNDDKWAVIVPGGYNNMESDANTGTGTVALYILNADPGSASNIASAWSGGTGAGDNFVKLPLGSAYGSSTVLNGLSTPAPVDIDGDGKVDLIYAGDLLGNMWRFDVRGGRSTWAAKTKLVYSAKDASGNAQPITSRPQVTRHPAGYSGVVVYFGTGKYIEVSDASTVGATTQTFYAVWDDYTSPSTAGVSSPTRANLLQQSVLGTSTVSGTDYRTTSNNTMTWRTGSTGSAATGYIGWYMDLPITGERVAYDPLVLDERILFTTVIPSDNACASSGTGWLMELRADSGGRLPVTPFDVDGDGQFTAADLIPVSGGGSTGVAAGGRAFTGIPSMPTVIVGGGMPECAGALCNEQKVESVTATAASDTQTPLVQVGNNPPCTYCRGSWRQIK